MKHAAAWLVALALSAPSLIAGESKMTTDQTDVLSLIKSMTASFEAKNIDDVMATYESEATVMFEPGKTTSEAEAMAAAFAAATGINPKFSYAGHEVIVQGDIALHIAPWVMTGELPTGEAIEDSGLSVAVARRQADGSWKMVIDNPHGHRLLNP